MIRDDFYAEMKPITDFIYEPMQFLADTFDQDLDYVIYFSAILLSFLACLILG